MPLKLSRNPIWSLCVCELSMNGRKAVILITIMIGIFYVVSFLPAAAVERKTILYPWIQIRAIIIKTRLNIHKYYINVL